MGSSTTPNERPTDMNATVLVGELVSEVEHRTMPSGADLVNLSVTVRCAGAATTSVPVAWYDPPAKVDQWKIGDRVVVLGSVVRRFYQAGGRVGSATEVVVDKADKVTDAKLARLLGRHQATIAEAAPPPSG